MPDVIQPSERDPPLVERRRPIHAPRGRECAHDDPEVETQDDRRHHGAEPDEAPSSGRVHRRTLERASAARDHRVAPPADPEALTHEEDQCWRQERRRQQGSPAHITPPVDPVPRLGGQEREVAADDQGIGKIGQDVDRHHQGRARHRRANQGKRDRSKQRQPPAPEVLGRGLQARWRGHERPLDGERRVREERQRLDRPEAGPPEDAPFETGESMGDQPESTKHQEVGESESERRREEGERRDET